MTWFLVIVIPFLIILAVLTVIDVARNVDLRRERERLPIDRSGY